MKITFGAYTLHWIDTRLSSDEYAQYRDRTALLEELDFPADQTSSVQHMTVRTGGEAPFLVITQACAHAPCQMPQLLFVPETDILLIGLRTYALAYKLDVPKKLWKRQHGGVFTSWDRYDEFIVMASDTELAAWDIYGWEKWRVALRATYHYSIQQGMVLLDNAGEHLHFPLDIGPLVELEEE